VSGDIPRRHGATSRFYSDFGRHFGADSGILSLMEDLGAALAQGGCIMMGGGNPGFVPEVEQALRRRLQAIAADAGRCRELFGIYDPPEGKERFRRHLAALLAREYGWPVGPEHVCLTTGSQSAFFLLFNAFCGACADGPNRRLLLPLLPEYIGYSDLGLAPDFFVAYRPSLELLDEPFFKYRIDLDAIRLDDAIGAICLSRPTNPTGNVVADEELRHLAELARAHGVPLIIDSAYGLPFPGIVYTEAQPLWDEQVIVSLSLSKFGMPGVRTGIVVARPDIVDRLSRMNAVLHLAPSGTGALVAEELVRTGEILRLARQVVRPFYQRKRDHALAAVRAHFHGFDYRIHLPEGAMFLWLWLPGLPGGSQALYERLKAAGVLVVSGHYFFPGLREAWGHAQECLRITYSQDDEEVARGVEIMAREIRRTYHG